MRRIREPDVRRGRGGPLPRARVVWGSGYGKLTVVPSPLVDTVKVPLAVDA